MDRLSSVQRTSGDSWSKSYSYNTLGLLGYETVTIDGQIRGISHYYDAWQRPYAVSYTDNDANPANDEVVKVDFNALGLPTSLCKPSGDVVTNNCLTTYANNASYDAAGRLTAVQYPAGGNLYRTQTYYGWTIAQNGGLLWTIKVGNSAGSDNLFGRAYHYNPFGEVLNDGTAADNFAYDGLGRLTSAYGQTFSYWRSGRFNVFNGISYGYANTPYHGVDTVAGVDRYDYDANGNMTVRNKGLSSRQTLVWNAENRLQEVRNNSGVTIESYVYDVDGNRIKKSVTSGPVTRTFFPGHYEEEVTGSITTTIKHYSFNGQIIATRRGTTLSYLHTDHLSSNNLATSSSGTQTASYTYYAYGTTRVISGTLPTDRTFTGQKQDSTGLIYLNARYYDPSLGTFLSPDTLVPDAGVLFDYNRFAYARLNPLKYTDPTGHDPQCEVGTSSCDAEWTLWRQYMQTEDAWSSWEDFLQGYGNYMSYASSPDTYLQDWLVRAGLADGDWQTSAQRLALAENFSTAVLGEGIPYFFNPDTPLEVAYQLAELSGTSGTVGPYLIPAAIVGGENAHTIRGREAHNNYRYALGDSYVYEQNLPSGRRPDAIDWTNRVVRELKPDTPRSIQSGLRQLKGYVQELESLTGQRWTSYLDIYKK